MLPLTVIWSGSGEAPGVGELGNRFELRLEPLEGRDQDWVRMAAPINRLIDDAPGWVLLLRSGELVPDELAREVAASAIDRPTAWAFRVGVEVHYDGGRLYRAGRKGEGEIRLFHAKRCRFLPKGDSMALQPRGPVVRLRHPLIEPIYGSTEDHRRDLSQRRQPANGMVRIGAFVRAIWRERARLSRRAVSYHWIEAGWQRGELSDGS